MALSGDSGEVNFDQLYRLHAGAAFRRAQRILGNSADAHEIVHDVFLCLFERPEQLLQLDEWLAGELSQSERERCEQHVQQCTACQARKQTIEQANAAYLHRLQTSARCPSSLELPSR